MPSQPQRCSDCVTVFLSGAVALVVFGGLLVLLLSWLFE